MMAKLFAANETSVLHVTTPGNLRDAWQSPTDFIASYSRRNLPVSDLFQRF